MADDILLELLVLVSVLFPITLDKVDVDAICFAVEGDDADSVDCAMHAVDVNCLKKKLIKIILQFSRGFKKSSHVNLNQPRRDYKTRDNNDEKSCVTSQMMDHYHVY